MSADYDKIDGLFQDLDMYLNRLKILERSVPPVPELQLAIAEVLTSVLVLCGIAAKYIKMKRIGKETFASLPVAFQQLFHWLVSPGNAILTSV